MKPKIFSGYLSSIFYAALLSVAFPLSAEEAKGVEIHLSEVELQEIFNNPKRSYVYVGEEVSALAYIMREVAKLDNNPASLVHGLVAHIEKGFNIGNYDAVAQALEEAEQLLINNADVLGEEKTNELTNSLDAIIEQVIEEKLNLDAELLSFLKDSVVQEDATKSGCCKPKPHCHGLRLLVVKEKVDFQGKVKFREDVRFKDDVVFEDDVTFEDNVAIEGSLSVADQIINCDLTVGCNLNLSTSTSATVGNIFQGGARFISNFGTNNTFVGMNSGNFTTSGIGGNTALGVNTLQSNTTGETNVAVGSNALASLTSGISNVAVGVSALNATTTSNFNIAIGSNTLLINTTGANNVGIGDSALSNNITGTSNVAIGRDALFLSNNDFNTAIGDNAGNALTTGSNNIAIGSGSGAVLATGSGNIYIDASAGVAAESTTTRIGTAQNRCFIAGIRGVATGVNDAIAVLIDSTGQLGTISSSATVKHDIVDMADASDVIMQLRPVTFAYNGDVTETRHYGLIAEEVDQVFPEIVVNNRAGKPETIQYHVLPVLLLNEFQKLAARVAALEALNN